ncbi:hypothetical protein [Aliidongia dinghuensis]|nr:hypothetical protein [Aliidongia dinghuensis]
MVELRLATPSELASVTGDFDEIGPYKGFVKGWQIIAIHDHLKNSTTLHIVGSFSMRSWITSDVLMLATDRSFARTRNSVYALGRRAEAGLSIAHLRTVARALKAWGLVEKYGLKILGDDELAEHDDA